MPYIVHLCCGYSCVLQILVSGEQITDHIRYHKETLCLLQTAGISRGNPHQLEDCIVPHILHTGHLEQPSSPEVLGSMLHHASRLRIPVMVGIPHQLPLTVQKDKIHPPRVNANRIYFPSAAKHILQPFDDLAVNIKNICILPPHGRYFTVGKTVPLPQKNPALF